MALKQVEAIVDGHPNMLGLVLPDQDLERQIDRRFGRHLHHLGSGRWAAEDEQGGRPEPQTGALRLPCLVNHGEQGELSLFDLRAYSGDRVLIAMRARGPDNSPGFARAAHQAIMQPSAGRVLHDRGGVGHAASVPGVVRGREAATSPAASMADGSSHMARLPSSVVTNAAATRATATATSSVTCRASTNAPRA